MINERSSSIPLVLIWLNEKRNSSSCQVGMGPVFKNPDILFVKGQNPVYNMKYGFGGQQGSELIELRLMWREMDNLF